jgi:hypothetical protein
MDRAAAEQAHPADAALRPQDRTHFEGWIRPDSFPDLAARLMGRPLGRPSPSPSWLPVGIRWFTDELHIAIMLDYILCYWHISR